MVIRPEFRIAEVDWQRDRQSLSEIRRAVFVVEQGVPEELEWDGIDGQCVHVLARTVTGSPIGTGRLLPDGHIGRMAVLQDWRRHGVGSALLETLIGIARRKLFDAVVLNAQTHATGFYAKHGFVAFGVEFLEAGIPHVAMRRELSTHPSRPLS
jgi:predicted GNAT family N-acyltransferase